MVGKEDIDQLIKKDSNERRMAHKLSTHHLDVHGSERQRVQLAVDIFSETTAKALRLNFPDKEKQSEFLQTFNDWFDVANSRRPFHEVALKSAYGQHLQRQNEVLQKTYDLVTGMRAMTKTGKAKKGLLPFQRGIAMSCKAIPLIFNYMKERYAGVQYLMTSRLQQDPLESFFSRVRGLGHTYTVK